VASWTAESGSVAVPYRYQGRRLQNASGATDLYDFGARSYDPDLGSFTSFDTVSGSAQNPLSLNRYLYAAANPATLVDPSGHWACGYDANTHSPIDCPDPVSGGKTTSYKQKLWMTTLGKEAAYPPQ
jgi:RHS repeat-associated protein